MINNALKSSMKSTIKEKERSFTKTNYTKNKNFNQPVKMIIPSAKEIIGTCHLFSQKVANL